MTDRYEQFKEWFKLHPTDEDELDLVFAIGNLFKEFETEQKEKEKEEEIKMIIGLEISDYYPNNKDNYPDIVDKKVNSIYKKLKEKDLIK